MIRKRVRDSLAVITTLYISDRTDCTSRIQNYLEACDNWRSAGVTVFTVESVSPGMSFISPNKYSWHLTREFKTRPWLKEHLLNYGIQRLPKHYSQVAWIDADILFGDVFWPEHLFEMLSTQSSVVQLFEVADWLGPDRTPWKHIFSCAYSATYGAPVPWDSNRCQPGMAWAATRNFLRSTGGLFYSAGSMSGDAIMTAAMGLTLPPLPYILRSEVWKRWKRTAQVLLPAVPKHLSGRSIQHLWHGSEESRNYIVFDSALDAVQFNPDQDLKICGPSGEDLCCTNEAVNQVFARFGTC